jgi:hypothetical protein
VPVICRARALAATLAISACTVLALAPAAGAAAGRVGDPCESDPLLNVTCKIGGAVADTTRELTSTTVDATVLTPLAKLATGAVETLMGLFLDLWMDFSSFDVHRQGALSLYGITLSVGWLIAAMLLIGQSIRLMVTGKPAPLLEAARGLIIMAVTSMLGVAVIGLLLQGSDALSRWILGDLAAKGVLNKQLLALMDPTGAVGSYLTLMISFVLVLVLLIQLLVLFLRSATLPVLAILLPVAAAGQVGGPSTRQWLPKTLSAVAAVICYKPIVSLIIVTSVAQLRDSTGVSGVVFGLLTMVLSVIAMPALMKVFAPLGMAAAGGGGGSAWLASAAMSLGGRLGSSTPGGADPPGAAPVSAAEHAQRMNNDGPGGPGADPSASPALSGSAATPSSAADPSAAAAAASAGPLTTATSPASADAVSTTPASSTTSTATAGAASTSAGTAATAAAAEAATGGAALAAHAAAAVAEGGGAATTFPAGTAAGAGAVPAPSTMAASAAEPSAHPAIPAEPGDLVGHEPGGLSVYDRN